MYVDSQGSCMNVESTLQSDGERTSTCSFHRKRRLHTVRGARFKSNRLPLTPEGISLAIENRGFGHSLAITTSAHLVHAIALCLLSGSVPAERLWGMLFLKRH